MSVKLCFNHKAFHFIGFCFVFVIILIEGCVPPTDRSSTNINLNFDDPVLKSILQYQDKGLSDSLYGYLADKDPAIRYAATKAFSSIKDPNSVDKLLKMLKDPILEVRAMAAHALGQLGDPKAETQLILAFTSKDTLSVNNIFNQNILEALGRLGGQSVLKNIASVVSYRPSDNHLLLGQMRALYRFGLRGIFDESAKNVAYKYIFDNKYPDEVRLMAAHYLSRFKEANIPANDDKLMSTFEVEDNTEVRMALANALGRSTNLSICKRLMNAFELEKDYRVKCNIVRSLANFDIDSTHNSLIKYTQNPNLHIAGLAADVIGKKGKKENLFTYKALINDSMDWRIKTKLYQAIMKMSPIFYTKFKNEVVSEILAKYNASKNPYERAAYIKAISNDPYQYLTLLNLKNSATSSVEKSSIVEGLGEILNNPGFYQAYGSKYGEVKYVIINDLIQSCKSGDPGIVAAAGSILKKSDLAAREFVKDTSWFEETKSKLKLPRDIEAYNEILETWSLFNKKPFEKYKAPYNHPINYATLSGVGDSAKVVMKTTKGNITFVLFSNQAPGSVANFLDLCKNDFYDNKVFHRVVPNFVIQAGCPRGDGYGALDYTIRSELNDKTYYTSEGFLGMASAGNHTEGTQFFITHSPAPHLDGQYTIFGKVIEGMNVVHDIQVGDKIIDAIILK